LPILIPCVVLSALIVMIYAKWQGRKAKWRSRRNR